LAPGKEGTEVNAASNFAEIKELLEGGVTLPDALPNFFPCLPHAFP
jgi:hypothetical protein